MSEILKRAPHPPTVSAHASTSIIEEVHAEAHDPNMTLLSAVSDEDREAKKNGMPKAFLEGRQKALDKYAPDAPEEFKEFLQNKQKGNKAFLEFYTGEPDVSGFYDLRSGWYRDTALRPLIYAPVSTR